MDDVYVYGEYFSEFEDIVVEYGNTKFEGTIFSFVWEVGYYAVIVDRIIHTDDKWLLENDLITVAEKYIQKIPKTTVREPEWP